MRRLFGSQALREVVVAGIRDMRLPGISQDQARRYRSNCGHDALAGLTAVALLAPECIAYAHIAGVPPAYVLSAAPVVLLVYAVLGRSVSLVVGATAATTVLSAAIVSQSTPNPMERANLIAALAVLSGVLLITTGLARCSFVARFLSDEALTGFLAALALVIFVRQFGSMVGVNAGPGDSFVGGWHIVSSFRVWHGLSLAVGLVTLTSLLILERFVPRIPATLVVLVTAWFASTWFDLHDHGVSVVGKVPGALPTLAIPMVPAHTWIRLVDGALGLALVTFVMSYSVSRLVAGDSQPLPNGNRELLAVGGSNLAAGLFGGLPVGGSPSASAAAHASGARTRLTLVAATIAFLLVARFVTPAFAALPEPALAAVVVVAVRHLISISRFRHFLSRDRQSFAIAISAVAGVLILGLLPGLLVAVAVSLLLFVGNASRLKVSELGQIPETATFMAIERHSGAIRRPEIMILRPNGELFFANMISASSEIEASVASGTGALSVVLLDLTATFRLDLSALDGLVSLRGSLANMQVDLWFVHLYLSALDAVGRSELSDVPVFESISAAVEASDRSSPAGAHVPSSRP